VGFVVDKVALGQVFFEYIGLTCQFTFYLLLYNHNHLSSGAGTRGQTVDTVSAHEEDKKEVIGNRTIFGSVNIYVTGCIGPIA
jgi:hypothetical protein